MARRNLRLLRKSPGPLSPHHRGRQRAARRHCHSRAGPGGIPPRPRRDHRRARAGGIGDVWETSAKASILGFRHLERSAAKSKDQFCTSEKRRTELIPRQARDDGRRRKQIFGQASPSKLRVTLVMGAGVADHVWGLEEAVDFFDLQRVCLTHGETQSKIDDCYNFISWGYGLHPRYQANHLSELAFDRRNMPSSLWLHSFIQTVEIQTLPFPPLPFD